VVIALERDEAPHIGCRPLKRLQKAHAVRAPTVQNDSNDAILATAAQRERWLISGHVERVDENLTRRSRGRCKLRGLRRTGHVRCGRQTPLTRNEHDASRD
jgi:hypothetical protein